MVVSHLQAWKNKARPAKNYCNLLEIRHMRWQCPHSMVVLMLLTSGMLVCRITTHLKPYRSLEDLYTSQACPVRVCFQEICWEPQKCIHQMSTEHIFHLSVRTFFYIALHNKWIPIYVSTWDMSCIFFVTFCDSFAFFFKINYCSVLVSVSLEDELKAIFPSSSFSLLIFKVAKSIPKWVLQALLAPKVAIHNCLLPFDFFMNVQHLPIATSTLASNAWPSTYSFVLLHTEVFLKALINLVYSFFPPMCLVLLLQ